MEHIYIAKPYLPSKERYLEYVDKIYKSGQLSNGGPLVRELESRLEAFLGVQNLILVANGTLALQVALRSLNLNEMSSQLIFLYCHFQRHILGGLSATIF